MSDTILSVDRPKWGPLGLGAWLFGWETPEYEAFQLMDRAVEAGISYIDTANNYGEGASERVVGKYAKDRRDQLVIGTKVFAPFGPRPEDRGLSSSAVRRAVEQSLRRLNTEYIDILYLHRHDPLVSVEDTVEALADLVSQGKIRAIGTSTFPGSAIDGLQEALVSANVPAAVCDQAPYSLLERSVEAGPSKALNRWGMDIVAWSPLGEGILTGKYSRPGAEGRLRRWSVLGQERFREGIRLSEQFNKLASSFGLSLPELALGWLWAQPNVACVLAGARTVEQLDGYLAGLAVSLPPEAGRQVNAIVAGGNSVLDHYDT